MSDDDDAPPDPSWVRQAVEDHQASLLRYAHSLLRDAETARDVVQDTFLRLAREPRSRTEGHCAAWLFTVCRNRALDHLRREGRMKSLDDPESGAPTPVAEAPSPAQGAETRELSALALRLLERLPALQRDVVRLKFQGGLSYEEIATTTGKTVNHVGVILHTALATLRRDLAAANALPAPKGGTHVR